MHKTFTWIKGLVLGLTLAVTGAHAQFTDRMDGSIASLAIKAPARVETTANITLSGLQTINSVALADGDRVLVKDQSNTAENGIYVARASAWERAKDFDGNRDVVKGTIVLVAPGTGNTRMWQVTTSSPVIGSPIAFTEFTPAEIALRADLASSVSGDSLVAAIRSETGSVATTQRVLNQARPIYFSADGGASTNGVTSATAAINSRGTNGGKKRLVFEVGSYASSGLTLSANAQHWIGQGWTSDPTIPAGATLLKNANGAHLTISGFNSSLREVGLDGVTATYTGDGVVVTGERSLLDNVASYRQRGDGFRWGGNNINGNLWLAQRPISVSNTGRGGYIHHTGGAVTGDFPSGIPDINAGVMIGGDFRVNGLAGLEISNAIDNVFIGTASQFNTGRGIVLKSDARGHFFLHPYTEGNNGALGNPGDEIDLELGAVQNAVIGMRFQASGGATAGIRDVNAPGKNLLLHYDPGVAGWVWRSKFSLWNPQQDGASTTVDYEAYLGSNQNRVFRLAGATSGASGGVATLLTKLDGGAEVSSWQADAMGRLRTLKAHVARRNATAYSASMTIDASQQNSTEITANNGSAFTINAPTNPIDGQFLTITVRNTSGGALGAATWNAAFKMAAWTNPASGFSRSITFRYDASNWIEISRTPADVPN